MGQTQAIERGLCCCEVEAEQFLTLQSGLASALKGKNSGEEYWYEEEQFFEWCVPRGDLQYAEKGTKLDSTSFRLGSSPELRIRFFPRGFKFAGPGMCSLYIWAHDAVTMQLKVSLNGCSRLIPEDAPERWSDNDCKGFHNFCPSPSAFEDLTLSVDLVELVEKTFEVHVYKATESRYGMCTADGGSMILISEVKPDGLIAQWNATHADHLQIKGGDCIIEANGVRGNSNAIKDQMQLMEAWQRLTIRRSGHTVPARKEAIEPPRPVRSVGSAKSELYERVYQDQGPGPVLLRSDSDATFARMSPPSHKVHQDGYWSRRIANGQEHSSVAPEDDGWRGRLTPADQGPQFTARTDVTAQTDDGWRSRMAAAENDVVLSGHAPVKSGNSEDGWRGRLAAAENAVSNSKKPESKDKSSNATPTSGDHSPATEASPTATTTCRGRYVPTHIKGERVLVSLGQKQWRAQKGGSEHSSDGIALRRTKNLKDVDEENCIKWGQTVKAESQGDGWVKLLVAAEEFVIQLQKEDGKALGLDVEWRKSNNAVYIKGVHDAGLMADWNSANPSQIVRAGDCIVSVNDVKGAGGKMMNELKTSRKLLKIKIRRPDTE